jgi:hypothetical protein
MSKHHVKVHKWVRGHLHVTTHTFDDIDSAVTFANNQQRNHGNTIYEVETEQVVKIYDGETDELVTVIGSSNLDTYA